MKVSREYILDIDPFSDEFLTDPYKFHAELRDFGAAFYMPKYNCWGTGRYDEVIATLKDHETFCSSRGAGLSDFAKEKPWRAPSLLLETDPPMHTKMRGIVSKILSVKSIKSFKPNWQKEAENLIDGLVKKGTFDAVADLAQIFPLTVFPDAIGIRKQGREHLLPYAALAFNAFGPDNWLRREALAKAAPTIEWITESCKRKNLADNGLGNEIFTHVDAGDITEAEGERLVRSLLTAGLDTTVTGIGHLIYGLAINQGSVKTLKDNKTLIKFAFDEVLRWSSVAQTFFRTTTRDTEINGTPIPEGSKVLLFLGAANRDPRHWEDAEKLDLTRRPVGHTGFGFGIHNCVGQMIARQEAEIILEVLLGKIKTIELAGNSTRQLNNTLYIWDKVPVKITPL